MVFRDAIHADCVTLRHVRLVTLPVGEMVAAVRCRRECYRVGRNELVALFVGRNGSSVLIVHAHVDGVGDELEDGGQA